MFFVMIERPSNWSFNGPFSTKTKAEEAAANALQIPDNKLVQVETIGYHNRPLL